MIQINRLVSAALIAMLALCTGDAFAARTLVAELLARAPAVAGQPTNQPVMSGLALEACLRRAGELDRTGVTVDTEVAAIDRLAAEGMFLQNQIDAELPALNGYDEKALNDFQRRVIRREELARKFKTDFPAYQKDQKDYNTALAEFDRDCSNAFTADDLSFAKAKLGIK
jgi:hypothetical protein